jgi:NADH-quinone oxidoreductase subunit K
MFLSVQILVFIILGLSARKLASYAPKRYQSVAYGLIVVVAVVGAAFRGWALLQEMGPARFEPTLVNFLMLSFLLFVVGVAGVLTRRNIIIIFMSIELILNAVNLNLIAFSRYLELNKEALSTKGLAVNPLSGPVFTIFIIVVAAAEAAVGLGIVIAMFRNRETIAIDEIDLLKW